MQIWLPGCLQHPLAGTRAVLSQHATGCCLQAWQPQAGSPILVTGGKDGRVLVYDVTEYAPPPEDDMPIPKFAAPAAVAPDPDLRDEVTALAWSTTNPKLLYAAHASGQLLLWVKGGLHRGVTVYTCHRAVPPSKHARTWWSQDPSCGQWHGKRVVFGLLTTAVTAWCTDYSHHLVVCRR